MPPEFSRMVKLEDVGKKPLTQSIEATPKERQALAQRLRLEALTVFKATYTLQWKDSQHLELKADFQAEVKQTCARTLDKLTQALKGHVSEVFTTKPPLPTPEEEMGLEELLTQPESLEGDTLDVGEILSQHLSLDLNPFAADEGSTTPLEHKEEKSKSPLERLKDLL